MFTRAEKKQENPKAAPSSGVLLGGARTPNSAMLQRPAGAPGGGNLPNSLMLRRLQGASGASTGADALQAGMQANRAPLPPTPAATPFSRGFSAASRWGGAPAANAPQPAPAGVGRTALGGFMPGHAAPAVMPGTQPPPARAPGFLSRVSKNVRGIGHNIGEAVTGAAHTVGGAAMSAGRTVGGAAMSAGRTVGKAAVTAGRAVGNAAVTAGRAIGSAATTAGHAVVGAAHTVGHAGMNDGLAVGSVAGIAANKVKDTTVGVAQSMQRKHQRAVDNLNNDRANFQDMDWKERAKWVAQNPLAYMLASGKQEDTLARNAHARGIERMAGNLRDTTSYDLGDAAYDPLTDASLNAAPPPPAEPAWNNNPFYEPDGDKGVEQFNPLYVGKHAGTGGNWSARPTAQGDAATVGGTAAGLHRAPAFQALANQAGARRQPSIPPRVKAPNYQDVGTDDTLGVGEDVRAYTGKASLAGAVLAPGAGFFSKSLNKVRQSIADQNADREHWGLVYQQFRDAYGDNDSRTIQMKEHMEEQVQRHELTGVQQGFGVTSSVLGAAGNALSTVSSAAEFLGNAKKGNYADASGNALSMAGSIGSFAGNVAKTVAYANGGLQTIENVAGNVIPGIGVGVGGLQMIGGGTKVASATATRVKMSNRMAAMNDRREAGEAGGWSRDDERMYRTAKQAKGFAKVRQFEGAMDIGAGALNMVGSAVTLGGVTAPVGAVISGAGTVAGVAKDVIAGKLKKAQRNEVVEEELGLDEKIQALIDQGIDPRDAKHTVLKAMGFQSGKRKEAFQHITMRRATDIHKRASAGDQDAMKMVDDLGLYKTGSGYSLQGIAEKLGMESGSSWQQQMQETAHSRDKNPFAERAADNREKVRLEQEEKARKEREKAANGGGRLQRAKNFFSRKK